MIKRMNKMKKGKKGSILIVVVLILALAIIFISTAMMLTQATRGRLYENTLQSQARLTVTAASEVFLEALQMQEINDYQMDQLLNANGVGPKSNDSQKLRMVVAGVPGMSATDDTNCTYMDVFYKDANKKVAVVDFKTIIGDQVESVRVYLDIKSSGPSYGDRFRNQIDIGTDVNDHELRFTNGVGMWNPAKTDITDNTILLRSNGEEHASSAVFYSDVVFAPGSKSQFGGSNVFHGNNIYLDSYMWSGSGACTYYGDFYFLGNTTSDSALLYSGGNCANQWGTNYFPNYSDGTPKNWVFMDRPAQNKDADDQSDDGDKIKTILDSKTCYFVSKNVDPDTGDVFFTANTSATAQNSNKHSGNYTVTNQAVDGISLSVTDNLKRYSASDFCHANESFPSSAETIFKTFSVDGYEMATTDITLTYDTYLKDGTKKTAGSVISAGSEYEATPLTASFPAWLRQNGSPTGAIPNSYKFALTTENLTDKATNGVVTLTPGYYYFTPGTVAANDKKPFVIAIDGSKADQYRFYFQENGTFNLGTLVFAVYNVKTNPSPVVFILEQGADIVWSGANYRETSCIASAGFISVQHVKSDGTKYYTNASTIGSFIRGTAYTDELSDWGGNYYKSNGTTKITYPYAYDSYNRPACYVFGVGGNEFSIGDHCMFEAYIGLYGSGSKFAARNDIDNNLPLFIYGRIEAAGFSESGTTGAFCMPYCPQPLAESDEHGQKVATSKFSVNNIIYYR